MSKLFQIHEQDLAGLEQLLPLLCETLSSAMDAASKVRIRRIQKILSDVRWNYGPHSDVEIVEGEI